MGSEDTNLCSKAESGCCKWEYTEPYVKELKKLENERNPALPGDDDPWEIDAIEFFGALIEAATQPGGLGREDYKAPLGRDVDRDVTPWLGEFRVQGAPRKAEGGGRHYRLYFAEPEIEKVLLSALLAHKTHREVASTVKGSAKKTSTAKQTKQIGTAMDITVRWCRDKSVRFRTI